MKALISGSFDPVTLGHLDIIERAAVLFDEVYAVVCVNNSKKAQFSLATRKEMLERTCAHLPNVKVDVCDGLLAAYTEEKDIGVIVRGIRDGADASYETMLATINRKLRNHPDTVFLPAKPAHAHISSSFVRDMLRYGEPLDEVLPKAVLEILAK